MSFVFFCGGGSLCMVYDENILRQKQSIHNSIFLKVLLQQDSSDGFFHLIFKLSPVSHGRKTLSRVKENHPVCTLLCSSHVDVVEQNPLSCLTDPVMFYKQPRH